MRCGYNKLGITGTYVVSPDAASLGIWKPCCGSSSILMTRRMHNWSARRHKVLSFGDKGFVMGHCNVDMDGTSSDVNIKYGEMLGRCGWQMSETQKTCKSIRVLFNETSSLSDQICFMISEDLGRGPRYLCLLLWRQPRPFLGFGVIRESIIRANQSAG